MFVAVPISNGGVTDKYYWTQSLTDVTVCGLEDSRLFVVAWLYHGAPNCVEFKLCPVLTF
jgi:hypothetical protein